VTSLPAPARSADPHYASVVLDVDSTLCGIEGIDWLAEQRGGATAGEVARLPTRAMNGEIALDEVYGARLELIRPSAAEITALALAYRRALAPGAPPAVAALLRHGVRVVLVSGGLRQAILPIAAGLRIAPEDVHAVPLRFGRGGGYAGFDASSPLTTQGGKLELVRGLDLPTPTLAVGDGATDLALRPAVSAFAAFTGFVRRAPVAGAADFELASFDHLLEAVLP
jgi:phosphoserine phosphatase